MHWCYTLEDAMFGLLFGITEDIPSATFVWSVQDFNLCRSWVIGLSMSSPSFTVNSLESKFSLKIFPGDTNLSPNRVCLELSINFAKNEIVDYELSFLLSDDTTRITEKKSCGEKDAGEYKMENCPTQEEVFLTKRSIFLPKDILKVQCKIWTPGKDFMEQMHYYSIGRIFPPVKIATAFSIKEFSDLRVGEKRIVDWKCPFEGLTRVSFILKLLGNETTLEEASLDLEVTSCDFRAIPLSQLYVVRHNGESEISQTKLRIRNDQRDYSFHFDKFITRQKLIDRNEELLPGDVLSLRCEFSFYPWYDPISKGTETILFKSSTQNVSNPSESKLVLSASSKPSYVIFLQKDLLSMYEGQKFSDFELRTGDTSFPVHKYILAARSPVLEECFTTNEEGASGCQDVPGQVVHDIDKLLLFVYTDIVQDWQWEEVIKLYYAADKYQIVPLRQKCSYYLQTHVDVSNVCEALEFADIHNDPGLKYAVEEFLLDHADETMNSDRWKMFAKRNSPLAAETMCKMFSRLTVNRK